MAFEILLPSNIPAEMERKREFYEVYGIEEYYLRAPDRLHLVGWLRQGDELVAIAPMQNWLSPRLGVRFILADELGIDHLVGRLPIIG